MDFTEEALTEYFIDLLRQHGSIDMADHAFKRAVNEDAALKRAYSEWCDAVGNTEKHGFADFCEEYMSNHDSIYNSLSDFNDE